jgi:hypothetical protein
MEEKGPVEVYREHWHIQRILEWFRQYYAGSLSITGLQQNVEAISGAIEGDIPKPIRIVIENSVGDLELARFGSEEIERERVERIHATLERLLKQYDSDSSERIKPPVGFS